MIENGKAKFVYEGARLHAQMLACPVVPAKWDDREDDFKEQFEKLIDGLCSGEIKFKDPVEAHDSWIGKYFEMGWKFGYVYDPEKKIHPDLVEFDALDPKEKIKDEVFLRLVAIAKDCMWEDE